MATETRECKVGDRVRIASGPYEGRSGVVTHVRCPEDFLFEEATKSLSGNLLAEPYALVKTTLRNEIDGETREDEIGVPVRRLRPIGG